jgi:Mg2+ and Co2+ transporter CorA
VRRRIHQLKDFIRVTPEWINYALIDNITDSFAPLIQHTELEVDSIDDLVLVLNGSEQNDMLRRIGSCRKTVMQLLRLLGPKADVLRSLIKRYEDKAKEISYNHNMRLRDSHNSNKTDSSTATTAPLAAATAANVTTTALNNGNNDLEQDEVKVHHEVTLYLGDIQGNKKTTFSSIFILIIY